LSTLSSLAGVLEVEARRETTVVAVVALAVFYPLLGLTSLLALLLPSLLAVAAPEQPALVQMAIIRLLLPVRQ
jgi:hypothetical protein